MLNNISDMLFKISDIIYMIHGLLGNGLNRAYCRVSARLNANFNVH